MPKYLNDTGLAYFWNKIKNYVLSQTDTKVSKNGDAMTGNLTNMKPESPIFAAKDGADLSESDNGLTANHFPGFRTVDALNRIISSFESQVKPDGTTASYMYVRNYADSSNTYAGQKGLKIKMDKTGAVEWTVDAPAEFRKAIDAVYKSGDTMAGTLNIKSSNIDRDAANPSGTQSSNKLVFLDKDGERIGEIRVNREADGSTQLVMSPFAEKTDDSSETSAWLRAIAYRDGTKDLTFNGMSLPIIFRKTTTVSNFSLAPGAQKYCSTSIPSGYVPLSVSVTALDTVNNTQVFILGAPVIDANTPTNVFTRIYNLTTSSTITVNSLTLTWFFIKL